MNLATLKRTCPKCKADLHREQTWCPNCQSDVPLDQRPGRGNCFCCGGPLKAPLILGSGLAHVGDGTYRLSSVSNPSCLRCGDPNPTAPSRISEIGMFAVVLQVLAWSIAVPILLWAPGGPYKLGGGKAFAAGVLILVLLCAWVFRARRTVVLALPLFALLTFWPFAVDGAKDLRIQIFIATLVVNVLAFLMLVKTRRKPFGKW